MGAAAAPGRPKQGAAPSGLSPAAPSLLSRVGQGEETQASGLGLYSGHTKWASVGVNTSARGPVRVRRLGAIGLMARRTRTGPPARGDRVSP